ncbi:hypothetical protein [Hephaestia caeni]|uniref:hypothetical protein n=1 Tax=Hephaestia caeni TaxID=645617 RepID=UPI000E5C3432|nr:hypothetical protein [Hephaestia caeni]
MLQPDLFAPSIPTPAPARAAGLPDIVRMIAEHSTRPRYTFMVLDLIARVARPNGEAGPLVREGETLVPIREWLAATIAPSGARHHQRRATIEKIRAELATRGELPGDRTDADRLVEAHLGERIRETGMTAISRAVSELVKAGLIRRHYQGFFVDHENRGAQRHAVYTVTDEVRAALQPSIATSENRRQPYVRGAHGQPRAAAAR